MGTINVYGFIFFGNCDELRFREHLKFYGIALNFYCCGGSEIYGMLLFFVFTTDLLIIKTAGINLIGMNLHQISH